MRGRAEALDNSSFALPSRLSPLATIHLPCLLYRCTAHQYNASIVGKLKVYVVLQMTCWKR